MLRQVFQNPAEHRRVHLDRQACARPARPGMIRHPLRPPDPQELTQGQAVGAAPLDPALAGGPLEIPTQMHTAPAAPRNTARTPPRRRRRTGPRSVRHPISSTAFRRRVNFMRCPRFAETSIGVRGSLRQKSADRRRRHRRGVRGRDLRRRAPRLPTTPRPRRVVPSGWRTGSAPLSVCSGKEAAAGYRLGCHRDRSNLNVRHRPKIIDCDPEDRASDGRDQIGTPAGSDRNRRPVLSESAV